MDTFRKIANVESGNLALPNWARSHGLRIPLPMLYEMQPKVDFRKLILFVRVTSQKSYVAYYGWA